MMNILQDFALALMDFPTALPYYLVLMAASGLAYLAANRAINTGEQLALPLRTAFLVVFLSQLVLLTFSLLLFQGYSNLTDFFPFFYQALTFITLVWIVWALALPQGRGSLAKGWLKRLPLILTLAAFLAGCLTVFFITQQHAEYGIIWVYQAWAGASLVLLLAGIVLILIRKHPMKLEGFLVLLIAALGYLVFLVDPVSAALPAAIVLSQLLYYPLLVSIAWQTQPKPAITRQVNSLPASPELAEAFLELNLRSDQEQIRNALTHSLSIFLMSDLLGLVELTSERNLRVSNTYDLIREAWLPAFELSPEQVPQLAAHFEDGLPFNANKTEELAEEKATLIQAMGYNTSGCLLLYPLKGERETPQYGLLCLTTYTNRAWTREDQTRLSVIAEKIVRVLDKSATIDAQAKAVEGLRISLNQQQRQNAHLREDLEHHQKLLSELRQEYLQVKNRYTKETQLWASRQKALEGKLASLEETLQKQAAAFAEVETLRQQKNDLEEALAKNTEKLSNLKRALASAQELLSGTTPTPSGKDNSETGKSAEMLSGSQAAAVVQAMLEENTENRDSYDIQLKSQIDSLPTIPQKVLATLQKVLQNLLRNAIAASPQGSSIFIELMPSEDQSLPESLEIRVTDQGGGLSKAEQSAFLSLLAGAEGDMPASIGNAQALHQAVALVQAAGGHWWIHAEPGQSTTYRVNLPLIEQGVL